MFSREGIEIEILLYLEYESFSSKNSILAFHFPNEIPNRTNRDFNDRIYMSGKKEHKQRIKKPRGFVHSAIKRSIAKSYLKRTPRYTARLHNFH